MKSLLKNKNFRLLWTSQIMSQITINVMNFLIIVRVYESTHSPIAASLIWVAYALPAALIGPIGAATVDLIDRRKVLMFATLSQSITILSYAFWPGSSLVASYLVVFLYSLFNQFYVPAESASLPYLVPKKDLTEANSTFFLSQQVSLLLAFVLAGVVAETLGLKTAFMSASILLLLAFSAVRALPKMEMESVRITGSVAKKAHTFLHSVWEGFKFIAKNRNILYPFALLLSIWTLLAILTVNLPLIGEQIVKIRPNLAGIIVVVPAVFGALLGTWLLSKYDHKVRKIHIVGASLLLLSIVFVVIPVVVPMLSFWVGRTVVVVSFAVAGLGYIGTLVPLLTYIQQITPKNLMGRVLGNFWFVSSIIGIMPVLFSATITQLFGIRTLLVVFGVIVFLFHLLLRFYYARYKSAITAAV